MYKIKMIHPLFIQHRQDGQPNAMYQFFGLFFHVNTWLPTDIRGAKKSNCIVLSNNLRAWSSEPKI